MGLKATRDKASKTVYFPSEDADDRIAFKIKEASWSVRKKINNFLSCRDKDGFERQLTGDMMEAALGGCVVGWETIGDVDIPEYSEGAVFELSGNLIAFLFQEIAKMLKQEAPEDKSDPN